MVKIEKFNQKDISSLLKWLEGTNDRFLYQFAGPKYHFPLTEQQLIQTIETKEFMPFKAIDLNSQEIVGHCQFIRVNNENNSASIGRLLINPDYRGKGYGTMMIKEMIRYAEDVLNLKKLELRVYDFNKSAIKCYKNIGFIEREENIIEIKEFDEEWTCITMEYAI